MSERVFYFGKALFLYIIRIFIERAGKDLLHLANKGQPGQGFQLCTVGVLDKHGIVPFAHAKDLSPVHGQLAQICRRHGKVLVVDFYFPFGPPVESLLRQELQRPALFIRRFLFILQVYAIFINYFLSLCAGAGKKHGRHQQQSY